MNTIQIRILILLCNILLNCQTFEIYRNVDLEHGDIEGNLYESPFGKFACFVPVDARYAVMEDQKNGVTFYQEDFGLFKIQALPVKPEFTLKVAEKGKEKALSDFVTNDILEKLNKDSMKANLILLQYSPEFRNGTVYFLITVKNPKNDSLVIPPFNSYAMMVFLVNDFIYVLTRNANLPITADPLALQKEIELAIDKLIDFHSRIYILGDVKSEDVTSDVSDFIYYEDEEELESAGGAMVTESFDLTGIFQAIQKRMYVSPGRFSFSPNRFKFRSFKINSNRFKMSGRSKVRAGRFKMKSSFKSRRVKF